MHYGEGIVHPIPISRMHSILAHRLNASLSDYLNTGTLFASFILALIIPFDLILLSYLFLGPAHYLTQISWMQQRSFFTNFRAFPWVSGILTLVFTVLYLIFVENVVFGDIQAEGFAYYNNFFGYIFYTSFIIAILSVMDETKTKKLLYFLAAQALYSFLYFQWQDFILALALFVPTLLHVYVFTWAFMLQGAIKNNSLVGYINCLLMIVLGVLIILLMPEYRPVVFEEMTWTNNGYFTPVTQYIQNIFSGFGEMSAAALMGFLSFAFTFHYLNWFSKVNVIKWHDVSKKRMGLIVGLYMISVSITLYDYYLGLLALIFLSIYHIITEFPLNILTFKFLFKKLL